MAAEPARHQFTVDDYYRLGEIGVIAANDRVELVCGEIIDMPPIGASHAACVERMHFLLTTRVGPEWQVRSQNPLRLGDRDEPVPDVMVVKARADFYESGHPVTDNVALLVEVSDTTLVYDRGTKAPMYARNGVKEVWIVDINGETVLVYRDPGPGGYRVAEAKHREERISSSVLPDIDIAVSDILSK